MQVPSAYIEGHEEARRRARALTVTAVSPVPLDSYAPAILRRRWLVAALATLVMLGMTAGVRFIGVTNDYRSLFDEDNPQLAALDALEETYTVSSAALIAMALISLILVGAGIRWRFSDGPGTVLQTSTP